MQQFGELPSFYGSDFQTFYAGLSLLPPNLTDMPPIPVTLKNRQTHCHITGIKFKKNNRTKFAIMGLLSSHIRNSRERNNK